jgi:tripartite motif-containing protein 71
VETSAALLKFGSEGGGDGQFNAPVGVAVDATGNIFVSDYYNSRIQVFDNQGTFLLKFGGPGYGYGLFYYPVGVAVDAAGNIYMADSYDDVIQVFAPDGGSS